MKSQVTTLLSTALLCVAFLATSIMFLLTGYYLYFFLAVTSLFFGATNLFLLILKALKRENFSLEVEEAKEPEEVGVEEEVVESEEVEQEEVKKSKKEKRKSKKKSFRVSPSFVAKMVNIVRILLVAMYVIIFYYANSTIFSYVKNINSQDVVIPTIVNVVPLLILFVAMIVCDRFCKHGETDTPFIHALLQNSRIFFKILLIEVLLAIVVVIVESLELLNVSTYASYIMAGIFYYSVVFITISFAVIGIRKEYTVAPYLNVPIPMWKTKDDPDRVGFVEYLEKNTGISMKSLWSVKYFKQIAPLVVLVSATVLWVSTCVVQVESYQQGAVYRFGALQSKLLQPGIHLTLPFPFDRVEIYDTEVVQKTTIGYRAEENADNIWTKSHGEEEYKLLLGGGDELVSINLRLEYKISDLKKYLKTFKDPKAQMEAMAYELVTDRTIETDLDTLLSADREAFALNFRKDLSNLLNKQNVGIEVVSVVLESIHPPVEIATVYQELISAEISAEKRILIAQGTANATIAKAQAGADTAVYGAQAEQKEKVAKAKANIAEFLASAEAYRTNKDAYTYYKYLKAVGEAYGNANLVILGDGVDESRLYFGNFSNSDEKGTTE